MSNFLRLIRFPNLVIIVLTMYLLQYGVLLPELDKLDIFPKLSHLSFFILVMYTICIAAAGNIINDIQDVDIDAINKAPKKQIIPKKVSLHQAWIYYLILNFLAFLCVFYFAFTLNSNYYTIIFSFLLTVSLLFLYSFYLKKLPFIGNVAIAFLCAYVPFLLYYVQSNHDFTDELVDKNVGLIFFGYTVFAFLSTLFREIIKDIEDIEGDKANNCKTLPILLGIKSSKIAAFLIGFILLLSVLFFSFILRGGIFKSLILNISISLPIIYALYLLILAEKKEDFAYLSKLAKWIMLGGIVFILVMKI